MTDATNVTQADRDAAADFVRDICELPDYSSPTDQPNLVVATTEELDELALDAFARHRTAAEAASKVEIAELVEALKECALLIAQNHGRNLTSDEAVALDNARVLLAKHQTEERG